MGTYSEKKNFQRILKSIQKRQKKKNLQQQAGLEPLRTTALRFQGKEKNAESGRFEARFLSSRIECLTADRQGGTMVIELKPCL